MKSNNEKLVPKNIKIVCQSCNTEKEFSMIELLSLIEKNKLHCDNCNNVIYEKKPI